VTSSPQCRLAWHVAAFTQGLRRPFDGHPGFTAIVTRPLTPAVARGSLRTAGQEESR
jgi:hypothetical protein